MKGLVQIHVENNWDFSDVGLKWALKVYRRVRVVDWATDDNGFIRRPFKVLGEWKDGKRLS